MNKYPLNSEELRKLKIGDSLYIEKRECTVISVGRKFIHTSLHYKINIELAQVHNPNYSQFRYQVFSSKEHYDYCHAEGKKVDEARETVRNFMFRARNAEILAVAEFITGLQKDKGS